jgi:hypothetical protein
MSEARLFASGARSEQQRDVKVASVRSRLTSPCRAEALA